MKTISTSFTRIRHGSSCVERTSRVPLPLQLIWAALAVLLLLTTPSAFADFTIRVAPQPVTNPIHVYVKLADPEETLESRDFSVKLLDPEGRVLADLDSPSADNFFRPPALDDKQRVSVMLTMDYSSSTRDYQRDMQEAALAFVNEEMRSGDSAGVIKFNYRDDDHSTTTDIPNIQVLEKLSVIDDDGNKLVSLEEAIYARFDGAGSPVVDAIRKAVTQFESRPANERKAVIIVTDGGDNQSRTQSTPSVVIGEANKSGVSIFSIGVGTTDRSLSGRNMTREELLTELALQTYGSYLDATDDSQILAKHQEVAALLLNEYRLIFPYAIEECNTYQIEVTVKDKDPQTFPVSSRCPPPTDVSPNGGGGALSPIGLIAGLLLLSLMRRRTSSL